MRHALVTGGAGFIGSHLIDSLLADGWRVTCFDNFDPFYNPEIKRANIGPHEWDPNFRVVRGSVRSDLPFELSLARYDVIVHLAARAGVRPSIEDPIGYQQVNVAGTQRMLEFARHCGVKQFVFASSSSVYGVNPRTPWSEDDAVLQPISPYASTKVSGELLGHVYSHLHGIRFLALRFFTVYGPRQRPDLAIHKFARLMLDRKRIPVFGDGSTSRDYTYVGDIVRGIRAAMEYEASPYEVVNLGNSRTVPLDQLIAELEEALGVPARIERRPPQMGDVPQTFANIEKARRLFGWEPRTSLQEGLRSFASWLHSSEVAA